VRAEYGVMRKEPSESASSAALLRRHLLNEMSENRIRPSERLPAENSLMERFAVTRSTVRRVLNSLAIEGLVERRRGSGTYRVLRPVPTTRSMLAGVWFTWPSGSYWSPIAKGIRDELARWQYHCVIEVGGTDTGDERQGIEALMRKGLDGFIVAPSLNPADDHRPLQDLIERNVPLVLVDLNNFGYRTDYVATHRELGAEEVVRHLVGLGHRRIAYFGIEGVSGPDGREQGYRQTMSMYRLPVNPIWVHVHKRLSREEAQSRPTENVVLTGAGSRICLEGCRKSVDMMLSGPPEQRPTAVFAVNDVMADVFVKLAGQRGLEVPRDISVAGFADASRRDTGATSWLTSYVQPTYTIGREAARLLIRRIEDPLAGTCTVLLQGVLVQGASTAPPPAIG
jgi:DNA-binding LacI/PurR family transcriptional regulator